ncbi:MAG: type I-C CRISPR-associated protein Cas8c/Csd1 [Tannerellaceae bacterium]
MILQALYEYYKRKAADPDSRIAPRGLEWKEIPYLILIDKEGHFLALQDTTEGSGKQKRAKRFLVIKSKGRSGSNSWQTVNIFWDHFGYVLAQPKHTDTQGEKKAVEDARKQNDSFVSEVKRIAEKFVKNEEIQAVSRFYGNPENMRQIKTDPIWEELIKKDGTNVSFKMLGSDSIIANDRDITALAVDDSEKKGEETIGICLITGKKAPITLLNSAIAIPGGKSGAKLVGFQKNSGYDSYYKEQGMNAPISKEAEDAYTTALNTLLGKESLNKYRLQDTSVVFWSQKSTMFEDRFSSMFSAPPKDDPDKNVEAIRSFLNSLYTGILTIEGEIPFYVLGLTPNAARISVRFWRQGTVKQFAGHFLQHFEDLEIIQDENKKKYYSVFNLLTQVSFQYKLDNLSPQLVSDLTQSILDNRSYPTSLQMQCLIRIKADRNITSIRAAILKAYLNRKFRNVENKPKEITMALDLENKNQAYLCGRLFAVLEKIQGEAISGANTTIRDRYYGAASTRPVTVFGRLISLSSHHLTKLDKGKVIYYTRLLQGVISELNSDGLPKFLSMDDQSRFAIGYYHQREELWTKKEL